MYLNLVLQSLKLGGERVLGRLGMGQSRSGGDRVPTDQWSSSGGPEIALLKRRRFPRLEPAHLPVPTVPLLPHSKTLAKLSDLVFESESSKIFWRESFFSHHWVSALLFLFYLFIINNKWREGRGVFGFWIGWESGDGVVSNIYIYVTLFSCLAHTYICA